MTDLNQRAEREERGGRRGGRRPWSQADLFAQLQKRGVIDEHGVNDKPKLRHCAGCGLLVWAAWENGVLDTVLADDVALTPRGEYEAWMSGRRTLDHWIGGLDVRTARTIRAHPASDELMHRIRPEHRCGDPPPEDYPRRPSPPDPQAPPPF
jgi:hypothetical protein